jgi:hypothetical protein
LCELSLLHARLRGFHRRFIDAPLRAKRGKLEPDKHLSAFYRVANIFGDFGYARGLRRDDGECRARERRNDSRRTDDRSNVTEAYGLDDDRGGFLWFGFAGCGTAASGEGEERCEDDNEGCGHSPDFNGRRALWEAPAVCQRSAP